MTTPERFVLNPVRPVTEAERRLVSHIMRWGSDSYPIAKMGRRWWIRHEAANFPSPFRTRLEAVARFEKFVDLLVDSLAWESWQEAERCESEAAAERLNDQRMAFPGAGPDPVEEYLLWQESLIDHP